MTLRTRTILLPESSGECWRNGVYSNFGPQNTYGKTCQDNVSPGDCWPFHVTETIIKGGRINGDYNHASGASFINFEADLYRMQGVNGFGHLAVTGDKGNTVYGTSAAARTTPSRPYIDVPVEALQLGDLVHLLKGAGENLFKLAANVNLAWQFGLRPIVEDIQKILSFSDLVERRIKELERLRTRGLRRTIPLGKLDSLTYYYTNPNLVVNSTGFQFNTQQNAMTVCDVGAHCRWIPTMDLTRYSPGEMRHLARKAVLGLTVDLKTAWELIPWTWMIDWGTNIGSFLAANRNVVPAALSLCFITRRTRTTQSFAPQTITSLGRTFTLSTCEVVKTDKDRSTAGVLPTAQFPFLSGNQLGILASLAITRA